MKQTDLAIRSAIATLRAIGLATAGSNALGAEDHKGMEKNAGVAKAGKNDCATGKHYCAGPAKVDGGDEWVYLPEGTCEKIARGTVVASKK